MEEERCDPSLLSCISPEGILFYFPIFLVVGAAIAIGLIIRRELARSKDLSRATVAHRVKAIL